MHIATLNLSTIGERPNHDTTADCGASIRSKIHQPASGMNLKLLPLLLQCAMHTTHSLPGVVPQINPSNNHTLDQNASGCLHFPPPPPPPPFVSSLHKSLPQIPDKFIRLMHKSKCRVRSNRRRRAISWVCMHCLSLGSLCCRSALH